MLMCRLNQYFYLFIFFSVVFSLHLNFISFFISPSLSFSLFHLILSKQNRTLPSAHRIVWNGSKVELSVSFFFRFHYWKLFVYGVVAILWTLLLFVYQPIRYYVLLFCRRWYVMFSSKRTYSPSYSQLNRNTLFNI